MNNEELSWAVDILGTAASDREPNLSLAVPTFIMHYAIYFFCTYLIIVIMSSIRRQM
jgi:hypothetical protein